MSAENELAKELESWWGALARSDMEIAVPKAIEYSSTDLQMMGQWMADMLKIDLPDLPGIEVELACMFYAFGKICRAMGAYREGRQPSIDTLRDIRIYTVMMQRARETGAWPGKDDPDPIVDFGPKPISDRGGGMM